MGKGKEQELGEEEWEMRRKMETGGERDGREGSR